jgi:hypothetical protein
VRFDPETSTVHAAGRTWHADPSSTQIEDVTYGPNGEYLHRTRRTTVRFETGWSASIVWGDATYSSNHDAWLDTPSFTEAPTTVEVGVLDSTGELRQRNKSDDDTGLEWHDVESYLDDDELAALFDRLATLPTDYDYGVAPPTIDEMRDSYETLRQATGELGRELPPWPDR